MALFLCCFECWPKGPAVPGFEEPLPQADISAQKKSSRSSSLIPHKSISRSWMRWKSGSTSDDRGRKVLEVENFAEGRWAELPSELLRVGVLRRATVAELMGRSRIHTVFVQGVDELRSWTMGVNCAHACRSLPRACCLATKGGSQPHAR
jgi:hypothetical protein